MKTLRLAIGGSFERRLDLTESLFIRYYRQPRGSRIIWLAHTRTYDVALALNQNQTCQTSQTKFVLSLKNRADGSKSPLPFPSCKSQSTRYQRIIPFPVWAREPTAGGVHPRVSARGQKTDESEPESLTHSRLHREVLFDRRPVTAASYTPPVLSGDRRSSSRGRTPQSH